MASSNRHWPSLFKSKPHSHLHQWQHDMISPNPLLPNGCHRPAPFSPSGPHHLIGQGGGGGGEERSPEPKPRWNPKPEQIRILEAIFNSGMVNPPREEIRKIRAQLQEYGQVGDANVFYWFQNRKSRSKNKQRHLHNASPTTAPSPTSSSSSEKSSSTMSCLNSIINSTTTTAYSGGDTNNSDGGLAYNNYNFATNGEFFSPDPPFLFPDGEAPAPQYSQGFCFSELSNVVSAPAVSGPSTNLLLTELMSHGYNNGGSKKDVMVDQAAKMKMETQLMMSTVSSAAAYNSDNTAPPSTINLAQGVGMADAMGARSTMIVFVNDVAFQVSTGPIHVRETFGDVALLNSNGQPVLTSEWGVTLAPLEAGAFYYVL